MDEISDLLKKEKKRLRRRGIDTNSVDAVILEMHRDAGLLKSQNEKLMDYVDSLREEIDALNEERECFHIVQSCVTKLADDNVFVLDLREDLDSAEVVARIILDLQANPTVGAYAVRQKGRFHAMIWREGKPNG